jgi:hypothetical protein
LENVRVERGLFKQINQIGTFDLYGKGEEIILFIYVDDSRGSLKIYINDNRVAVVKGIGIHVINVPVKGLYKTNTLRLEASVPLLFWQNNFYNINKVIIKETYTIYKTVQTANVKIENISGLDYAKLNFNADCLGKENLMVTLNSAKIYDERACSLVSMKVNISNNNLFIFSSKGDNYLHDITLDLKFKMPDFSTYYFNLDSSDIQLISDKNRMTMLKMQFDSTQNKKFDLHVNGLLITKGDTNNIDWQASISQWLREGQNSIKIIPRTNLNILDMKVEVA